MDNEMIVDVMIWTRDQKNITTKIKSHLLEGGDQHIW
jgi:hypothetical protein